MVFFISNFACRDLPVECRYHGGHGIYLLSFVSAFCGPEKDYRFAVMVFVLL
jgi:hypothetical protein